MLTRRHLIISQQPFALGEFVMSEAGVGSFVADIVASVAFFLLPDSIADEAQVVFLVLLVVGFIALRVRGRRRRRSEEAAGGAVRDRVASGHDPLAGWVPPGVGDTRGGRDPVAGSAPPAAADPGVARDPFGAQSPRSPLFDD